MPLIPTFEAEPTPSPAPLPTLNPAAAGQAGAALAEGARRLEGTFAAFEQRYAEARRQTQASQIVAAASQKLGDMQHRWSLVPDREQAYAGFQKEAGQLQQRTFAEIEDPLVKAHVVDRVGQEAIIRGLDTQTAAFKLESDKNRGDLDLRLDQFAQSAATTASDALRAKLLDDALADIHGSVAAGYLHPEEGARRQIGFKSRLQEVAAEQDRNAVLASRDPAAAHAFAAKINDPASYPGLLPQARAQLGAGAEDLAHEVALENQRLAAAVDRGREKQAQAAEDGFVRKFAGDPTSVSPADIANSAMKPAAKLQWVAPGGILDRAIKQGDKMATDPQTYIGLFERIHLPDGAPQKINNPDELNQYFGRGLTAPDFDRLRQEIALRKAPDGAIEAELKNGLIATAKSALTGTDPLLHLRDPNGDVQLQKFMAQFLPAYQRERAAGKTPVQLLDPNSPSYLGKAIDGFKRSRTQMMQDLVNDNPGQFGGAAVAPGAAAPPSPDDLASKEGIQRAYNAGRITRDAAAAALIAGGFARAPQ